MSLKADYLAISFPKNAADMIMARQLANVAGEPYKHRAQMIAKIERAEAIPVLQEILDASDGIMVARGDLAVEVGNAAVPALQKRMIKMARASNKIAITATQMMESMITSALPTRAEVSDVANAVMDGTDAVMLSAETATGRWPVKVVEAMARVCIAAESAMPPRERAAERLDRHFERTDEAIAMATTWTARHMHATAIVSLTESGSTALMMSRAETQIPIYALTQHERTRRRMALCRGVYPVAFQPSTLETLKPVAEAIDCLVYRKVLSPGDRVLVTKGDFTGPGGTNSMKIVTV
jgi:pyruvate kinase